MKDGTGGFKMLTNDEAMMEVRALLEPIWEEAKRHPNGLRGLCEERDESIYRTMADLRRDEDRSPMVVTVVRALDTIGCRLAVVKK